MTLALTGPTLAPLATGELPPYPVDTANPAQAPALAGYVYENRNLYQWRAYCATKLGRQRVAAQTNVNYYDGNFPLRMIGSNEAERQTFRRLLKEARANWCELIVNAVAERLGVVGFNFGDEVVDALAWFIWQCNQLDADSEMAQTDALVTGQAFVSVQPDEDNPCGVSIAIEHATECTVVYAPGSRRKRLVAYKEFVDEVDGSVVAVLELPEVQVSWRRPGDSTVWPVEPYDIKANPLGIVSTVELTPAPATKGAPRSELHTAKQFQNRINTTIFNRLVATDYGAFRQIWATGITLAKTVDGRPKRPFDVGADRLLVNENPEARFGAFAESTLSGYLGAVDSDVKHLAAITQTPPHYLLGTIVNASGDALKAAETGLVAKVRRRAAHLGEGWEEVMRLALFVLGNPYAADQTFEVVWRDFESRSEGETVDALTKMDLLGVPKPVLWQRWGASPQQVRDWEQYNRDHPPVAVPDVSTLPSVEPDEENA